MPHRTLSALEAELNKMRQEVLSLSHERRRLMRKVGQIDRKIAYITGNPQDNGSPKLKKQARPPSSQPKLKHVLLEHAKKLGHTGEHFAISALAKSVLDSGYQTTSGNFTMVVGQLIRTTTEVKQHIRKVEDRRGFYKWKE